MDSNYVCKTVKFSPSLMVWGAIRSDGCKILHICEGNVNSQKYQDILNLNLPQIYNTRYIFQQDGATCHTSQATTKFLLERSIRVLQKWPS